MKILNFIGHSCTGKTTLSTEIFNRNPKSFWLAYDYIKWRISGYHRDTDGEKVAQIDKDFLRTLIQKTNFSLIISDVFFATAAEYESFEKSLELQED